MRPPPDTENAGNNAAVNSDAHVRLIGVGMRFSEHTVLRSIDLEVRRGEVAVIIGGSGTGKTTLLRIMIGLQRPTAGQVCIDGEDIAQLSQQQLRKLREKTGMVFQYSALLDSLSVMDNVALPLREHERLSAPAIEARVRDMLQALGLAGTEARFPAELSGGMRKRVGLARALIRKPQLVVYDEPASGLDPLTARRVDDMILDTRDRFGVTSIVISHSMSQAARIADRIYLLDGGRVAAAGTARELMAERGTLAASFFEASAITPREP